MSHISEKNSVVYGLKIHFVPRSKVKNVTCQILLGMGVSLQGRGGGHKKLRPHIFMPFVQMMKFWVACKLPKKFHFGHQISFPN